MDNETKKEKPQDGLALIIGGLFILALIFAAYNYFKSGRQGETTQNADSTVMETQTQDETQKGDLNGNGAKDDKSGTKSTAQNTGTTMNNATTTDSTWTANNYNKGEIKGTSYTVKRGDTLWEIAEGAYGDGHMWTKILEANKANIKYLPNGQQSLIVTGQTLVLP